MYYLHLGLGIVVFYGGIAAVFPPLQHLVVFGSTPVVLQRQEPVLYHLLMNPKQQQVMGCSPVHFITVNICTQHETYEPLEKTGKRLLT